MPFTIEEDQLDCFDQTIPTEQKPFKPTGFYVAAQQYYREDGLRGGVPSTVPRFDERHWQVEIISAYPCGVDASNILSLCFSPWTRRSGSFGKEKHGNSSSIQISLGCGSSTGRSSNVRSTCQHSPELTESVGSSSEAFCLRSGLVTGAE